MYWVDKVAVTSDVILPSFFVDVESERILRLIHNR
jgi:hypothetical protein